MDSAAVHHRQTAYKQVSHSDRIRYIYTRCRDDEFASITNLTIAPADTHLVVETGMCKAVRTGIRHRGSALAKLPAREHVSKRTPRSIIINPAHPSALVWPSIVSCHTSSQWDTVVPAALTPITDRSVYSGTGQISLSLPTGTLIFFFSLFVTLGC